MKLAIETRSIPEELRSRMGVDIEIRAASFDVKDNTISGYAIVFNQLSEDLGGFREIVKPEAVQQWMKSNPDIPMLREHDWSRMLARTASETLKLNADERGLSYAFDIPNTTDGNDVREQIKRGDLKGASFGFRVMPDGDQWATGSDGSVLRTLLNIDVREISLTPFPAYRQTTAAVRDRIQVIQRSPQTWQLENMRMQMELSTWL